MVYRTNRNHNNSKKKPLPDGYNYNRVIQYGKPIATALYIANEPITACDKLTHVACKLQ